MLIGVCRPSAALMGGVLPASLAGCCHRKRNRIQALDIPPPPILSCPHGSLDCQRRIHRYRYAIVRVRDRGAGVTTAQIVVTSVGLVAIVGVNYWFFFSNSVNGEP